VVVVRADLSLCVFPGSRYKSALSFTFFALSRHAVARRMDFLAVTSIFTLVARTVDSRSGSTSRSCEELLRVRPLNVIAFVGVRILIRHGPRSCLRWQRLLGHFFFGALLVLANAFSPVWECFVVSRVFFYWARPLPI